MYRIVIFAFIFVYFSVDITSQNQFNIKRYKREVEKYKNNDPNKTANAYLNLADEYFGLDKQKSINYYKLAIKLTKSPQVKFKAYKSLYIFYQKTNTENEIKYLKQTVIYADSAGRYSRTRFNYRTYLCKIYLKQKEFDKAIEIGNEALALSFVTGSIEDSKTVVSIIVKAYKSLNNTVKYSEYATMLEMNDIKDVFKQHEQIKGDDPYLNKLYEDFINFKQKYANRSNSRLITEMDKSITDFILNIFESSDKLKTEQKKLGEKIKEQKEQIEEKEKRIKYLDSIKFLFGGLSILIFILLTFALWGYLVKKKQHTLLNQQKYKIELQAKELNTKNGELTKAFDHLKNTQDQLVQTEKMASLGQLIAGIAHELNTPLGAIKSSIGTVLESSSNAILMIPELVKTISNKEFKLFTELIEQAILNTRHYTSKEERAIKKQLRVKLEKLMVDNHRSLADTLTDIGIHEIDAEYLPLFNSKHVDMIMKTAYNLIIQNKNGQNIKIAVDRASKIIFALKSYSYTTQNEEMIMSDITNSIETVLTIYHNQLKHGIAVERKYDDLPEIKCFPDELSQVWTNIIYNSIQAMDSKGRLTISTKKEKKAILVSFADTGKGIPKDIQDKIFEPFFTTKAEGEGTGLGLDIIRKIVEKHKGTITFESAEGVGTTFFVKLPIV